MQSYRWQWTSLNDSSHHEGAHTMISPRSHPWHNKRASTIAQGERLPHPLLFPTEYKPILTSVQAIDKLLERTLQEPTHNTGSIRFPFSNFRYCFHSLFKVLCIFPSRYLFAIGLPPVFSFRWNLPPTLDCNPKQPDSSRAHRTHADSKAQTGLSPSLMRCYNTTSPWAAAGIASPDYNSGYPETSRFSSWALPASLAVTRGILVSFFSSA